MPSQRERWARFISQGLECCAAKPRRHRGFRQAAKGGDAAGQGVTSRPPVDAGINYAMSVSQCVFAERRLQAPCC